MYAFPVWLKQSHSDAVVEEHEPENVDVHPESIESASTSHESQCFEQTTGPVCDGALVHPLIVQVHPVDRSPSATARAPRKTRRVFTNRELSSIF